MTRFALCAPAALLVSFAACTDTTTLPAGSLAEPVAMTVAQTSAGPLIFVADATGNELRAFDVGKQLFVRGPNAISPLSMDVGFRPSRLASGNALDASGAGHPLVVVAGSAPALGLVDANQQTVVARPSTPCVPGTVTAFCLPAPATDVVIANGELFATVAAPQTGGAPSLAMFKLAWQNGPQLTFDRAIDLTGEPVALAALSDGSRVYVADHAAPRIVEVNVAGGVLRDLATAAPVARVALTPAYTDAAGLAHPEGELALAILADGRLQAVDVAAGAPAPDPYDASMPATPLDFGSPVLDVAFLPCANAECSTGLQLSSADTESERALAFAALGDGSAIALQPDPTRPELVVPVTTRAAGQTALITKPSASDATFTDPVRPEKSGTVSIPATGITTAIGFTRSETFTVTSQGVVPGLSHRPSTLAVGGASVTDDAPTAFTGADVKPGDSVDLAPLGAGCAALTGGVRATITAVDAQTLTLANPTRDLSGCADSRVIASVRVAPTEWTVVGSASGDAGRATSGTPFTFAGTRFFYPPTSVAATAPSPAVRVGFTVPAAAPDDADATFSFATTSGFSPFTIAGAGVATTAGGLANAVVTVHDVAHERELVYVAEVGSSALVQVEAGLASEATGTVVFH